MGASTRPARAIRLGRHSRGAELAQVGAQSRPSCGLGGRLRRTPRRSSVDSPQTPGRWRAPSIRRLYQPGFHGRELPRTRPNEADARSRLRMVPRRGDYGRHAQRAASQLGGRHRMASPRFQRLARGAPHGPETAPEVVPNASLDRSVRGNILLDKRAQSALLDWMGPVFPRADFRLAVAQEALYYT